MAQKITYWLLISLVLSLGFGQLLRFELFSVPIYPHDILVVLILVLMLLRRLLNRNSWLQAKKGSPAGERTVLIGITGIYLFLLSLVLSSLYALTLYQLSSLLIPSLYMFRLLAYLSLYFALKHSKITIPLKYFCISAFISLFIGLSQYFLMPDMRWAQSLGWDDHLSRLTLPHFDPTFTAVMLCLFLLAFISLIPFPFSLLTSLAILLTYSRSVWLSLVFTAMLFVKNKKILLISIILIVVSIITLPKKFGEGTNLLRTYSISSRLDSDYSYIQKYKWDLLIGRGMNSLILDSAPSLYDDHATGPNNSYLYLLTTTGVLGLLGWGMFMFTLYQRSAHKPMLIFFFTASLFNNVTFYPFALLWVLLVESHSS